MSRVYLDRNWLFTEEFKEEYIASAIPEGKIVNVPHTVKETAFNYFDEHEYQMVSCYQKNITYDKAWKGKNLYLVFEAVAHQADVYINGEHKKCHKNGYNAFSIDVTDLLCEGDNLITVKCNSKEDINQPPFGYVVDYMTYGGIYRDVYLEVKEPVHIISCFYKPIPMAPSTAKKARKEIARMDVAAHLKTEYKLSEEAKDAVKNHAIIVKQYLNDKPILELPIDSSLETTAPLSKVKLWDIESPTLYNVKTELVYDGKVVDSNEETIGFRDIAFKPDGFYLNGRKVAIRGLNRHQSYPYVGYAMPESIQRDDARILKNELGVNTVRTSHYSQSKYFMNECDKLGLLVVTEFPGWQHIGDKDWKHIACKNVKEMIKEFRNHPSIILWGVRINESEDDEEFYKKTNNIAHHYDPTRPTGGTKAGTKMQTFEDVYAYNDFLHNGTNEGCHKKKDVVPKEQLNMPYLVTEYNGHMYPTKNYDTEEHRRDHMLRHAKVMNDIFGTEGLSGGIGWCMFDYNTHKDFGSGDRICYHGVCDMFRNPKLAAQVYASESDDVDVLELASTMDVGEHPECNRGRTYILSNMDYVKMYKNDKILREYTSKDSEYSNLKHGPILMDTFVSLEDMIEGEGYSKDQAKAVGDMLNWAALNGWGNLIQLKVIKMAAPLVFKYHMDPGDAVKLFQRYVGDWGGESAQYKLEGYKNGKLVKTQTVGTVTDVHLETKVSSDLLVEDITYDVAAVRIRALDQFDNLVPFFQEAVVAITEGPIELIGPEVIPLRGGMCGLYVKTKGEGGKAKITLKASNVTEPVTIPLEVVVK
ncbi:MAG: glycoside hydrolase family 2 protein [Lachnospiraceae bacterium]|nr:glycoside hydrolase family 2 protein [Lachnospiraceae bacterium]